MTPNSNFILIITILYYFFLFLFVKFAELEMSPNACFEMFHSSLAFIWAWRNDIESHEGRFMSSSSVPDTILGMEGNYSEWTLSRIFLLPLEKIMRQKPTQKREDDRINPTSTFIITLSLDAI
jgi:hypothetical protein